MRILFWNKVRVLKAILFGMVTLTTVYILVKRNESNAYASVRLNSRGEVIRGPAKLSGRIPHRSYPEEVPVFLGFGNKGNFEPRERPNATGPGEMGKPHKLKPAQREKEEKLKYLYGFNQLVSDEIALNRSIPDCREEECQYWDYPEDLPTASVILVFHNEGWSTLFRNVISILNRSPPQFLHEIILVDDKSELEHCGKPLELEILKPVYQGKVKLVRNHEREGLIRSKNNGAVAASGEVVVFLDAHCEVSDNWLPPLLAPIHKDRKTLTVPVIDGIHWDTFHIERYGADGSQSRGIFEWGMFYKEDPVPLKEKQKREHHSEPYYAPTHAGGLFAIDREWFKELGWYDPGLWIWGGENFELAFKVWMCGGNSVWVPCSRVAHVYRGHSCSSCNSGSLTNKFGGTPTTLRNYKRVVETWFDDKYKEYFYTREPLARFIDIGDISEQLALKDKMECKSFDWFMNEIAYDVLEKFPPPPPNIKWGTLKNQGHSMCLDTFGKQPPEPLSASGCHSFGGNQLFRLNGKGQLTTGELRIVADPNQSNAVVSAWGKDGDIAGPWKYDDRGRMRDKTTGLCMELTKESAKVKVAECKEGEAYQRWEWKEIVPFWAKENN